MFDEPIQKKREREKGGGGRGRSELIGIYNCELSPGMNNKKSEATQHREMPFLIDILLAHAPLSRADLCSMPRFYEPFTPVTVGPCMRLTHNAEYADASKERNFFALV